MSDNLGHMAERVKSDPHFLASVLDCWQRNRGWDDEEMRRFLSSPWPRDRDRVPVTPEDYSRLQLCGVPRHRKDVDLIAERFGLDADRLADVCGIIK